MTGISSYSTTAAENVQANTGVNWDEGMAPGQINNSARQNMADLRAAFDDLVWFAYGIGSKTVAHSYASATSTTILGADVTAVYHAGRRVRAAGATTGTIYGTISSSSYASSTTTVNYVWDSGALANETLTISISQVPVTGTPIPARLKGTITNDNAAAGLVGEYVEGNGTSVSVPSSTATNIASISLTAGDWDVSLNARLSGTGGGTTSVNYGSFSVSLISGTVDTTTSRIADIPNFSLVQDYGVAVPNARISLANTATVYLVAAVNFSGNTPLGTGSIHARRVR